jgi:hypothetical protein
LAKLLDQRDFKTRQHNAAVEQGLSKEAADLKLELSTLDTAIAARQTIVPDDAASANAIDQLQRLVTSTQQNLQVDRAAVAQQLEQMQQANAKARPADANLTPAQQTLSKELAQGLANVSAAGLQHASFAAAAADPGNKPTDDEVRALEASAAELGQKIQSRKQDLAAATPAPAQPAPPASPAPPAADPQAAVEAKQRDLATAEQTRAKAEAAYFAANKKVHDLKDRLDQARAAGEKRDTLVRQRDLAQKNLDQLINQEEFKKNLAAQRTYPAMPTANDLKVDVKNDPRPMYALAACGAIIALCVGLSFITTSAADDDPYGYAYPQDGYYETDPNQTVAYAEAESATPVEV